MKGATYYIRKYVPRKYIHTAIAGGRHLLALAYIGDKMQCPVCGKKARKFFGFGVVKRPNAMCPHCFSLERHRLMWLYLQRETELFANPSAKVLHIAPERCFIKHLDRKLGDNYVSADLDSPLAKVKMNIEDIQFPDGEFDVIFCNHVLEHVDDDRRAMRELYRVMKPGGWGIMLVPLNPRRETTYEDPSITTKKGREEAFGQWDHVREYGIDYFGRLEEAGFKVERVDYARACTEEERARFNLGEDQLYVVRKPSV